MKKYIAIILSLIFVSYLFAEDRKYNYETGKGDIVNNLASEISLEDIDSYYGYTASPPTVESALKEVGASRETVVSDVAYGASWNGTTLYAPSKNAVYDKIETISGSTPGGSDSQLEYNNNSAFGGAIN